MKKSLVASMTVLAFMTGLAGCVVTDRLAAGRLSDAEQAYERRDYATAVHLFRTLAERGHVTAQYELGAMYYRGEGVPEDYAQAALWYRKAARQGHVNARYNLGFMYYEGQGVPQDYAKAAKWYRKAAEQGDRVSREELAMMYKEGLGVPQDDAEAQKWGDAAIRQSNAQAALLYLMAAAQGDPYGPPNLGRLYAMGQGVPQDFVQAYKWFDIAAANLPETDGRETAAKYRDEVAAYLTEAQIAEAQKLAREWKPAKQN